MIILAGEQPRKGFQRAFIISTGIRIPAIQNLAQNISAQFGEKQLDLLQDVQTVFCSQAFSCFGDGK